MCQMVTKVKCKVTIALRYHTRESNHSHRKRSTLGQWKLCKHCIMISLPRTWNRLARNTSAKCQENKSKFSIGSRQPTLNAQFNIWPRFQFAFICHCIDSNAKPTSVTRVRNELVSTITIIVIIYHFLVISSLMLAGFASFTGDKQQEMSAFSVSHLSCPFAVLWM